VIVVAEAQLALASCVPPTIALSRSSGAASSFVTVRGTWFQIQCIDVVVPGQPTPTPAPDKDISIRFIQGSRSWLLATVNASSGSAPYRFTVTVRVPRNAALGAAHIQAVGRLGKVKAAPVVFRVTGIATTGYAMPQLPWFALFLVAAGMGLRRDWTRMHSFREYRGKQP
jgi:hypothetical protein